MQWDLLERNVAAGGTVLPLKHHISCSGAPNMGHHPHWDTGAAAGQALTLLCKGRGELPCGEKRLSQGLGLRGDVMDTDLGFSHEKVLRSLQFGGGIGVLSH